MDDLKMDGMDVMDGRGTFQGTTASLWDWDGRKLVSKSTLQSTAPRPQQPHASTQLWGRTVAGHLCRKGWGKNHRIIHLGKDI